MNPARMPSVTAMDAQLEAEHRRIRELTSELENATDLGQFLACIARVRSALVEHFHSEEAADGFYDRVRSMVPTRIERLDGLEREHQAFLKDLDALVARTRACLAGPVAEILGDARLLAQRLSAHELAEDEFVADALYGDLGQGD